MTLAQQVWHLPQQNMFLPYIITTFLIQISNNWILVNECGF